MYHILVKILSSLLLCGLLFGSGDAFQFTYGQWEHCYYEPASNRVDVDYASVQIVQSPNHLLGFQAYMNITVADGDALHYVKTNARLWHAETGDRIKYGDSDGCIGFFYPDRTIDSCPIQNSASGMYERLFIEETIGEYELQFQIFDDTEEVACVVIPFKLTEEFLSQFQQERLEKLEQKQEEILLL